MGVYGNRGEEVLTEDALPEGPPADFFVELGRDWESAADPALAAGIRVVNPRFGLVLTPAGGALARMLPPFLAGTTRSRVGPFAVYDPQPARAGMIRWRGVLADDARTFDALDLALGVRDDPLA